MKIYTDKTKTIELSLDQCNLEYGELEQFNDVIHHPAIAGKEGEGHYEVVAEYPNGGKDVKWVEDVPGIEAKEAWDEIISYQIYTPYSENRLSQMQCERDIEEYQNNLNQSDYQALKFAEGLLTEEEYAPIREMRQGLRHRINVTRSMLAKLKEEERAEAEVNN